MKKQCDLAAYGKMNSNDVDNETPFRVWSPVVDLPGLAMSRSIGDGMAKGLGVIAEPEIKIFYTTPESKLAFIALASDGIWDVIDSNELMHLFLKLKGE